MAVLNNPMGALKAFNVSTGSVALLSNYADLSSGSPQDQGGGDDGDGGSKGCEWDKGKKACDAYLLACGDACRDKGGVDVASCGYSCDGSTNGKSCHCINESNGSSEAGGILSLAGM